MVRFINIDNGRTFNGDQPYVHWFDDEQSIDLIYVQKICLLTDCPSITVFMPENNIFRLLDTSVISKNNQINLDGVGYQDITKMYTYIIPGDQQKETTWVRTPHSNTVKVPYYSNQGYSSNNVKQYHVSVSPVKIHINAGETFNIYVNDIRNIADMTKLWLSTEKNTYHSSFLKGTVYTYVEGQPFSYTPDENIDVYINIEGPVVGSDPHGSEAAFMNGTEVNYTIEEAETTKYTFPIPSGAEYGDDMYVHMIYIAGSSNMPIEARESFFVQEHIYTENPDPSRVLEEPLVLTDGELHEYTIGADFHDEREELKISLANQGVEIPESIQKAIYTANIHEEARDNILMNRKYKELLLDFIDILGNKGSYKSLINSLNWFEYGDLLNIKEFWKHNEWDKTIYNDQDFSQQLTDQVEGMLTDYSKTTFMGIYCACQKIKESHQTEKYPANGYKQTLFNTSLNKPLEGDDLDPEGIINRTLQVGVGESFITVSEDQTSDITGANFKKLTNMYANMERFLGEAVPEIENNILKWSRTDLSIKLALLGNFFETYFMPIHLDLIHSTIEDIVFTNTTKAISGGQMTREDYIIHDTVVDCNIKDNDIFLLGDVKVQANSDTAFVNPFNIDIKEPSDHHIFGVDEICTTDDFKDIPSRVLSKKIYLVISPLSTEARNAGPIPVVSMEKPVLKLRDIPDIPEEPKFIEEIPAPPEAIDDSEWIEENREIRRKNLQLQQDYEDKLLERNRIILDNHNARGIYYMKMAEYREALAKYEVDKEAWDILQQQRHDYVVHTINLAQYYVDHAEQGSSLKSQLAELHTAYDLHEDDEWCPQGCIEKADSLINPTLTNYISSLDLDSPEVQSMVSSYGYGLDFDEDFNKTLDPEIATIILNSYTGVGVVVPFVFTIPLNENDIITKTTLTRGILINDEYSWDSKEYDHLFQAVKTDTGYYAQVIFKMLCTRDTTYDIRVQFTSTSGMTYTHRVTYNVIDTRRAELEVYKVKSKGYLEMTNSSNDYMFSHTSVSDVDEVKQYYTQYIPIHPVNYSPNDTYYPIKDSDGAHLQWMTILRSNWEYSNDKYRLKNLIGIDAIPVSHHSDYVGLNGLLAECLEECSGDINIAYNKIVSSTGKYTRLKELFDKAEINSAMDITTITTKAYAWLVSKCDKYHRSDKRNKTEYDIFVAKYFSVNDISNYIGQLAEYISKYWNCDNLCLRTEFIYIPQSHYIEELDRTDQMTISVYPEEALCVIPNIKCLRYIDSYEWDFFNVSTQEHIQLPSVKEPFIGRVVDNIESTQSPYLKPGYYDITFRYKLSSETDHINEVSLKSAFIQLPDINDCEYIGTDLWKLAIKKGLKYLYKAYDNGVSLRDHGVTKHIINGRLNQIKNTIAHLNKMLADDKQVL